MIGVGYRHLMRPRAAIDYLSHSVRIAAASNDDQALAMSQAELGESYDELGELKEAERSLLAALDGFAKDPECAHLGTRALQSLARVRRKMRRTPSSRMIELGSQGDDKSRSRRPRTTWPSTA